MRGYMQSMIACIYIAQCFGQDTAACAWLHAHRNLAVLPGHIWHVAVFDALAGACLLPSYLKACQYGGGAKTSWQDG